MKLKLDENLGERGATFLENCGSFNAAAFENTSPKERRIDMAKFPQFTLATVQLPAYSRFLSKSLLCR